MWRLDAPMALRAMVVVASLVGSASPLAPTSKNMIKFEAMCERFASHPASTLARVDGSRKQLLCRAASSALDDARVVDAVGILYDGYAPVRVAGNLIFHKLEACVAKAAEADVVVGGGGAAVAEARTAGGGGAPGRPAPSSAAGFRFEAMVDDIQSWARTEGTLERAEATDPRLAVVLKGCFAGVENDEVTAAFRVVFEDYVAFRMAGKLIYTLMKRLVGAKGPADEDEPTSSGAFGDPAVDEARREVGVGTPLFEKRVVAKPARRARSAGLAAVGSGGAGQPLFGRRARKRREAVARATARGGGAPRAALPSRALRSARNARDRRSTTIASRLEDFLVGIWATFVQPVLTRLRRPARRIAPPSAR